MQLTSGILGPGTITTGYAIKLKEVLDLVLNDTPDLQDDTLMMKCLDSVRAELKTELMRYSGLQQNQSGTNTTLRMFLLQEILESQTYRENLCQKDTEVVQFFFELVAVYIEVFGRVDSELLVKTIAFFRSYFEAYFQEQFLSDPTICCSILKLLSLIYDQVNSDQTCLLPSQSVDFFNQTLIDVYMFSQSSIHCMLQVNCKSIFVRRLYKDLLRNHLICLIEQKLRSPRETPSHRLDKLIDNFGKQMPLDMRMHNVDVISDLVEHLLFGHEGVGQHMRLVYLFELFDKLDFNGIELDSLLNCEHLTNDASIEAFTVIVGFGLFKEMFDVGSLLDGHEVIETGRTLMDVFRPQVEKICRHFADYRSPNNNTSDNHLFILFKKSSDFLFKFLMYLHTFINKLVQNSLINQTGLDFRPLRDYIEALFVAPLTISLNNNQQQSSDNNNTHPYLDLVTCKPFKWKQTLLKQCLANLKLFFRKQTFNLRKLVSTEKIIYVLRSLLVDASVKDMLMSILFDYHSSSLCEAENTSLSELSVVLVDSLRLRINDQFNENLFRLIALDLTRNSGKLDTWKNDTNKLIEIIQMHLALLLEDLGAIVNRPDQMTSQSDQFRNQFELVLQFLIKLLENDTSNLKIVNEILNSNNFLILKISTAYVNYKNGDDGTDLSHLCNVNDLEYVQNTIYEFYQKLFGVLSQQEESTEISYLNAIFNTSFMSHIKHISLNETEAFIRRPCVQFQVKYQINQFKLSLKSSTSPNLQHITYLNSFNHFTHLLTKEFDWQVQIYCLEFFQQVLDSIMKDMDKCGYKKLLANLAINQPQIDNPTVIEVLCFGSNFFQSILSVLTDYDSTVVYLSAKVLIELSSHQKFLNLLEEFLKKDSQFWTVYYKELESKFEGIVFNKNQVFVQNFLDVIRSDRLDELLLTSRKTTDLYTMNPLAVLDDLINSYQFKLEDETHIDCY